MGEGCLGKVEDAVALLDEACASCDAATCHIAGISVVCYLIAGSRALAWSRALYPCGHIDSEDVWCCTIFYADRVVAILKGEDMLVVVTCAHGAKVAYLSAASGGEWRWSHGDALELAKEVADVRCLVVAAHLPYHSVAILVV